jgi:hypothetical protein
VTTIMAQCGHVAVPWLRSDHERAVISDNFGPTIFGYVGLLDTILGACFIGEPERPPVGLATASNALHVAVDLFRSTRA